MIGISRYCAIDMLRARKDGVRLEAGAGGSVPAAPTQSTLAQRALERCRNLMSADQRHCMVLAYEQRLTHDDIATELGYPPGTVKGWLRRALSSLRGCVKT